MTITITVEQPLAKALEVRAAAEKVSVEEFALRVLAEAVASRNTIVDPWKEKNQRRVDLIRKSNRGPLSQQEQEELQQLQTELDQRLEHSGRQLLDEVQRMEEAISRLPDRE